MAAQPRVLLWELLQGAAKQIDNVSTQLRHRLLALTSFHAVQVEGHLGVTLNGCVTLRLFPWPSEHGVTPNDDSTTFRLAIERAWTTGSACASSQHTPGSVKNIKTEVNDFSNEDSQQKVRLTDDNDDDGVDVTKRIKQESNTDDQFVDSREASTSPLPVAMAIKLPGFLRPTTALHKRTSASMRKKTAVSKERGRPRQSAALSRRRASGKESEDNFSHGPDDDDSPIIEKESAKQLTVEPKITLVAAEEEEDEGSECSTPSRARIDAMIALAMDEALETGSLYCPQCGRAYPRERRKVFGRHVRKHWKRAQCEVCGKWLSNADALKYHQIGLHSTDKPYHCGECGMTFSFKHSYTLHRYKHSGDRPHTCQLCHKTYLTASHLHAHQRAKHSNEVGKSPYQCDICGQFFASKTCLANHSNRHLGVKPYHCDVCPKAFSSKSALRLHAGTAHSEDAGSFQCDMCSKFYKTQVSLQTHKKRHYVTAQDKDGGTQFVCDTCGKQFQFQSSLKAHASVHNDVFPFICPVCGKGFKLQASLYSHKYTHATERPFQCTSCPKTFKTKGSLVQHEQRHVAGRTFSCDVCTAVFPDKSALDKHSRTLHEPKKLFACRECGKSCARMDNLRTHLKSHGKQGTSQQLNHFIVEIAPADQASSMDYSTVHTATPAASTARTANRVPTNAAHTANCDLSSVDS